MITENLSTLKIHKLTQEQYDRELANNTLDDNAIYLTPEKDIDLSPYATIKQLSESLNEAKEYTNTKTANLASAAAVDTKISTHNVSDVAHNDIRLLITDLTAQLNTLANSSDETLAQMNELVGYIESNQDLIESITTGKVNVSDIVNNLTTNVTNKPLGADQGVVLKELIDSLRSDMDYSFSAMFDDVNANIEAAVADKADSEHTHDDRYYTESEIDTMLANLGSDSDSNHTHTEYMSSTDPVGTGSFSMNRKAGTSIGGCSHTEGWSTTATGMYSHAEGHCTTASGGESHAEGWETVASGEESHAEGFCTVAEGSCSHAEGWYTTATGRASHAEGCNTRAQQFQHAQGHYNNTATATLGCESGTSSGTAFVIGNGTETSWNNAFRVTYEGKPYAKSSILTTGADYAELFEWQDLDPDNEDRRGYFVTLDGEKIKIAEPDDYILGIVSGQPAVIGNGDEDWKGRYILDEFGAFIIEEFEYDVEVLNKETGEMEAVTKTGTKYKENPDYDPSLSYIQREDRPEWDAVGMVGVLSVRDDGTCEVNGYCKVTDGGIATASESGYRVIKRINENIVKVIFK